MTILTIIEQNASDIGQQDAAELQNVTRADIYNDAIRLFDGRKKVDTLPLPESFTAATIDGILAGMAFPTTLVDFRSALEDACQNHVDQFGSVVPDDYRYRYGADQNCGDDVAKVLRDECNDGTEQMSVEKLVAVAAANQIADRLDVWMTKGLNNGMLRMNTGNVLRGMVRRGEVVRVGAKAWNVEQPEA